MTTRNLDALFQPRSVALIGASAEPGSVGAVLASNLLAGDFKGAIYLVNPHQREILSTPCFASIDALPAAPDLAVIAIPPGGVAGAITQLGAKGCRAAVLITAGGSALRTSALEAARPFLMRIVGPNCLGLMSPAIGVNASFAHLAPLAGDIALLTQSGAIATSMLDWATGRGIGFSHIVSLGDMSDVDFGDLLDFLALDGATKSILLYVENVTHARKFMSAGRIAARAKPVIVVKAGRSAAGAAAAASHTGALAGADAVYDAAFRRAGMLRVESLRDLFDAAATLASGLKVRDDRLAIVTNGGGLGVLAADALEACGGRLAQLSPQTRAALDTILPPTWSHANPIDILGDARGDRYRRAVETVAAGAGHDAILVLNCPTGVADSGENAQAVLDAAARAPQTPLLACWMGDATVRAPRSLLSSADIPTYETPDEAARAFMQLVDYARNQSALLETPEANPEVRPEARTAARALIEAVQSEGRALLTEPEAKRLLAFYGVPVVETRIAANPVEAAEVGASIQAANGAPVALKILSRDITHKSDVGGVRLNLATAAEIETAASDMLAAVQRVAPAARIDGFTIQPMVARPLGEELILGLSTDATFGPVILFGQGGVAVEIVADSVMGLAPLNSALARDMIARTRVAKLLAGYRNRRSADIAAILRALVSLSDLVADLPEIAELDINPLLADHDGVIALDARVVVRPRGDAAPRFAIRPYPSELAREIALANGARLGVRPIRPEDASALAAMAAASDARDLRLRFHGAMRALDPRTAARLSQIDYDREMAFVAIQPDTKFAGVVRLVFDPDFEAGEFAIIVRTDLQGQGLGGALMHAMFDYARTRGAKLVWGDVLRENSEMLALARELGASFATAEGAPELIRASFDL